MRRRNVTLLYGPSGGKVSGLYSTQLSVKGGRTAELQEKPLCFPKFSLVYSAGEAVRLRQYSPRVGAPMSV